MTPTRRTHEPAEDQASALDHDDNSGLARIIAAWTQGIGNCVTPIENLAFFRFEKPSPHSTCLVEPSIVIVIQGAKEMLIGSDSFPYGPSRFLITSLDMPANSSITEASPERPLLGLTLKLDLRMLAELIAQGGHVPPRDRNVRKSAGVGTLTPAIMAPISRLVELLEEPEAIAVLAPLIQREIHYRLLMSDQAGLLRQIVSIDSQGHRVARAIDWLKRNYAAALRVEDLAARVGMSPPTFHHHFRQLTAMSPLQYQKWLRLNEARRLMLNEQLDAASAAFQVGYESPSQFSREYGRQFGSPPKRDIVNLRRQANDGDALEPELSG